MGPWKSSPTSIFSSGFNYCSQRTRVIGYQERLIPLCPLHSDSKQASREQFCEYWDDDDESAFYLPMVHISLKALAPRLHALLDSHSGHLALNNFLFCYECQFNERIDTNGPSLVPLEHLISCIPGVEIVCDSETSFKYVQWSAKKPSFGSSSSTSENSSSYADCQAKLLQQFGREVRDLLKNQPRCLIPFAKFVPAYHNHFGRQCCVYQYGYTKLIELLEAVPNVVQIIGGGTRKILTLTHREQTKRFASDLIRILKVQPKKKMVLEELPSLYEKTLEKTFNIENYGVCQITDIISDVWEGTVLITYPQEKDENPSKIVIEIPRKVRTVEEKERTKVLVKDIIKLLQSTQNFLLPFSKFIPTFHHYFNRQCKVSDYGFTKLIELFESLSPEIIELEDNKIGDEKIIKLSKEQRCRIITGRLLRIVKNQPGLVIGLDKLADLYKLHYGCAVPCKLFGVENFFQLASQLTNILRLITTKDQIFVIPVDKRRAKCWDQKSPKISICDKRIPSPPLGWLDLSDRLQKNLEIKASKKPKPRRIAANFNVQAAA